MKAWHAKKNDTDVADRPKTHGDEGNEEERYTSEKTCAGMASPRPRFPFDVANATMARTKPTDGCTKLATIAQMERAL